MRDIEIRGLSKSYGEKKVLDNLTMTIPHGKITCLMGPSGSGKTTLINILAGLTTADEGTVLGLEPGSDRISEVFQENRLCENYSAFSNVKMVTGKDVSEEDITAILAGLGLENDVKTKVRDLSGGMKRRVAVARAIAYLKHVPCEHAFLILDEPFTGLDDDTKAVTAEYIKKVLSGTTVIIVTHDKEDAELFEAGTVTLS